jgi:hypothetical protein
MEGQEIELYALRVLKDEYQDDRQCDDPDNQGSPSSAEASLAFARIVFRLLVLTRGFVRLLILSRPPSAL